ncbi:hypothetical protein BGW38_007518 [Lunasporangiospora selenospora]|uniref:Protein tyrosine phosphatase n=1 Tax=Lunasporangiospora selenospora TaxID=979761 RepID=A0A9P6FKW0_9FUNG|nr:hypothetical protein BGW38_007518 [Lunasporangiospora selenospora]
MNIGIGGFNAFVHDHASLCSREGEVSLDNGPEGTQPYQIGSYAANSGHGAGHTDNARRSCPSKPVVANTATTTKSAGAARAPLRCRLHLGSLPGSTLLQSRAANGLVASGSRGCSNNNNNTSSPICQTPMLENPNVNPLFESVRQSMGLNSNITEEISVRYPAGMNAEKVKQVSGRLPQWLSQAVQELHGKTMLANLFQKIEKSEKKRLALLMLPEAMRVGQPVTHSLCAGLEKGLKNRYSNVWPFDQTRIKLQTSARKDKDDYINASLLRPSSISKSYIATQAPLPSTIPDFWQMVDEQESSVIVMLTREQEMGRIKCHQYWPTALEPVLDFGRQKVEFVREWQPNPAMDTVLVRQLRLYSIQEENMEAKSKPEGRLITQIQYTGWPDLGVPETPLQVLEVIRLANEHNKSKTTSKQAGPMVVHCSAGCGRTGAFCVIDTILSEFHEQLEAIQGREEAVPPKNGEQVEQAREKDLVFALVDTIRDQRLSMVQTLRQYVFCYEAILWHLMISHLKIEGVTGLSGLDRLASLNDTSRQGAGSSCGSVDASRKTSADNEFSFFG